ncbi:MAG TPA: hypothetical protein VN317_09845 [Candidatus Methanoperedens sp.]|nr:hypothetical protein [Candidatus Methanoperedens sp.]
MGKKSLIVEAIICLLLLASSVSTVAGASASYTLIDMGIGVGGDIANNGKAVGSTNVYDLHEQTSVSLPSPVVQAYSINEAGQIAGLMTSYSDNSEHAFLLDGGVLIDLGALGGPGSGAYGINNRGQVVGSVCLPSSVYPPPCHAFLYDKGTMIDLGDAFGGDWSLARAVNDRGQIVGTSYSFATDKSHGILYDNGEIIDLGVNVEPWAINNSGQVVGYYFTDDNVLHSAFLYDNGEMIDLSRSEGETEALDINNNGQVLGNIYRYDGQGYDTFLYKNGSFVNLDLELGLDEMVSNFVGFNINDLGQIVGMATIDHFSHAVVLDPKQHPTRK